MPTQVHARLEEVGLGSDAPNFSAVHHVGSDDCQIKVAFSPRSHSRIFFWFLAIMHSTECSTCFGHGKPQCGGGRVTFYFWVFNGGVWGIPGGSQCFCHQTAQIEHFGFLVGFSFIFSFYARICWLSQIRVCGLAKRKLGWFRVCQQKLVSSAYISQGCVSLLCVCVCVRRKRVGLSGYIALMSGYCLPQHKIGIVEARHGSA